MERVEDHTEQDQCQYISNTGSAPIRKWCQVCGENSSHITQDCHHVARMAREYQARGHPQTSIPNNQQNKQAQPVLGTQPHALRMVGLRYVGANKIMARIEMVSAQPYQREDDYLYADDDQPLDYWAPHKEVLDYTPRDSRELMLFGP